MTNPRIFQVECNEISLDLREINKNRKNLDRSVEKLIPRIVYFSALECIIYLQRYSS